MQPDTFKAMIQNRYANLENMVKALLRRSFETSVTDNLEKYGLEEKNEIIRLYNGMTSDLQNNLKSIYNDFMQKIDNVIQNAVKTSENNYKIACYSNDIFFNDNSFGDTGSSEPEE
ncbi:MAG: hypothetical protein JXK07_12305 [Spirochaetes bacterium]|nr:hypothetical protein [Spirochaetota bacterium]MBN2771574.1 hypothetical protein [Spirochaetota bacterium]